ncbi:uncharacterized protein LOC143179610 [Calliopsis andreniformis]|uniref:uncharacterized protein LOC143179610 n=1 Tax=Calliopsis andreniformis TaxID=337506 RepID=UPI003FCC427A
MSKSREKLLPKILRSTKYKTQSFKLCRCACKWRCQCLIPREKKPSPPFNVGMDRDVDIGLHPKFYTNVSEAPPLGSYNPKRSKCKSTDPNWKKELEDVEYSATMGWRDLKEHAIQKDLMRTGRGPGTHEIPQWPENVLQAPCKTIQRDVGFGTVPLFKPAITSTTPGPAILRD